MSWSYTPPPRPSPAPRARHRALAPRPRPPGSNLKWNREKISLTSSREVVPTSENISQVEGLHRPLHTRWEMLDRAGNKIMVTFR